MTVEDVFGLVLRFAGVALVVLGAMDLFHVACTLVGVPVPTRYAVSTDMAAAVEYVGLGLTLFFGADAIARFAYRGRR